MLYEKMRAGIGAASRAQLAEVGEAMWRAFGAGALSESEATTLQGLIEARGMADPVPAGPAPVARVGSRPRSGDSLARRRRWAASGWMPAALAARFTLAEAAALAVLAHQASKSGDCRLPHNLVAALAGVSRSTVRAAIRQARRLGLVTVEERRVSRCRNLSNVVRIVSRAWTAWLRLRADTARPSSGRPCTTSGGGVKSPTRTITREIHLPSSGKLHPLQSTEEPSRRLRRDWKGAA